MNLPDVIRVSITNSPSLLVPRVVVESSPSESESPPPSSSPRFDIAVPYQSEIEQSAFGFTLHLDKMALGEISGLADDAPPGTRISIRVAEHYEMGILRTPLDDVLDAYKDGQRVAFILNLASITEPKWRIETDGIQPPPITEKKEDVEKEEEEEEEEEPFTDSTKMTKLDRLTHLRRNGAKTDFQRGYLAACREWNVSLEGGEDQTALLMRVLESDKYSSTSEPLRDALEKAWSRTTRSLLEHRLKTRGVAQSTCAPTLGESHSGSLPMSW